MKILNGETIQYCSLEDQTSFKKVKSKKKLDRQGNIRDMGKIPMTRYFFEASGRQGNFYEKKQKNYFWIWSRGLCVQNFKSLSFFVWPGGSVQTNIYTSELKKTPSENKCQGDFDGFRQIHM